MRLVEKGNRGTIDPDLSYASERLLDSALTLKKAEYGIDKLLTPADTVLLDKVEAEIKHLAFTSRDMHVLNGLALPPTIDSLMEASGNRYAVAMVGSGYSRTRLNFSNKQRIRVAKEIVLQGNTFGAKYPEKAVSIVHALLLDSKENKVVYYRQNRMPEREPTNANIVTTQVNSLLVGLFMNN
ncbi:hypothetical protein GCM10023183_33910 [Nibribacter koreensis]|uniref:Uncharacterized protein n=2 Tax=Nibribacter koreensis TaxID=1084519 RepID=A0ABP8FZ12_9BACT